MSLIFWSLDALLNAIINALSHNILSEAVIQGKSFS